MIWGLNRTSGLALVAAAGLAMGGWSLQAKAADLGGNCCADLEERVADLEATTARKGNRKVSLEISGQVDRGLMAWNDGKQSDVYIVDNYQSSTRMRMKGTGAMAPGWKAGFYIEYEFIDSGSNIVTQTDSVGLGLNGGVNASGLPISSALRLRQENAFLDSEKFGRVTIGLQSPAAKDIVFTNLGGSIGLDPENSFMASFFLRDNSMRPNANIGTTSAPSPVGAQIPNSSRLQAKNFFNAMDSTRIEAIRYDTPSIFGFILSTSFGQNDFWDVALRYQKEWSSFRIAAGVGYTWSSGLIADNALQTGSKESEQTTGVPWGQAGQYFSTCRPLQGNGTGLLQTVSGAALNSNSCVTTKSQVIAGSVSVMHMPTGLYTTWAAGTRHLEDTPSQLLYNLNKDATYWYGQAGMTKRVFEPGATTVYFDFAQYKDYAVGDNYGTSLGEPLATAALGGFTGIVTSSNVDRWGVGVVQAFEGAALELYTKYEHYSYDATTRQANVPQTGGATAQVFGILTGQPTRVRTIEDQELVMSGARLKF
jgi:predicted porin